jgi:acetyl/propionyl-CoA carboxylase alpha subunit
LESGIESGNEISGDYDPMIAKLIVTAINRKECFQKAVYVLQNTTILGPTTNRDFLISVLENAKFQKGGVSTQFLNEEFGPSSDSYSERDLALAIAKAISGNGQGHSRVVSSSKADTQPSLFQTLQFGRDVL